MNSRKYPRLVDVVSQKPPYPVAQRDVKDFAYSFFKNQIPACDRLLSVFDNAGVEKRYFSAPLDWIGENRSFEERNNRYIQDSLELSTLAAIKLFEKTGIEPSQIDHILFVSTTGLATPSIDARLIGELGLKANTRRIPIWGLGCAGGVLALAHCADLLRGYPGRTALIINVELCGLTFNHGDFSKSNFIATALFGDGATAALVVGGETEFPGAEIIAQGETTWPGSKDVMGWNFQSNGMQVVFSRKIPQIVREKIADCLADFLAEEDLQITDIDHFLIHPGGAKVIRAYEEALSLNNDELDAAKEVMRSNGNCSSCSVMHTIEEFLKRGISKPGEYGLVTALGPGFSAGNVLLKF
ncbi:MAG: hypothetical protein IIB00_00750 [candidate division Zixibacteria bacterium]|nr:hypothetical protein [candidate division Zixibacteria bacterium]